MSKYKIYCDGGSRGNPGPSASGYVIFKLPDDQKPIISDGKFLGNTTNNQAEWQAVVLAIEKCLEIDPEAEIELNLDSELVVRQILGIYRVKNPDLKIWYDKTKVLLSRAKSSTVQHVYRANNKLADAEVNRVLDSI